MGGSTFGKRYKIHTFGESHGEALGVIIDGVPAGLPLSCEDLKPMLSRRQPGKNAASTSRSEADEPEILSGVFEGVTTGTPLTVIVRNNDQHSKDYSDIADKFRPGHADFGFYSKFGIRDYRGGGRSSGRETVSRVIAGAVAEKILSELNVKVLAYTRSISDVTIDPANFDEGYIYSSKTGMPDKKADELAYEKILKEKEELDSLGGVVECIISGVPAGLGEPVFDKLDARLSQAVFSIGAVKGFEVGRGFESSYIKGSENNDAFVAGKDGKISKKTNNAGGILGGISDGDDIVFRAYFKPTPSIARDQETADENGENIKINIKGRHDPVVVPRAAVVVEAMAAITILDMLLDNMGSRLNDIKKYYE